MFSKLGSFSLASRSVMRVLSRNSRRQTISASIARSNQRSIHINMCSLSQAMIHQYSLRPCTKNTCIQKRFFSAGAPALSSNDGDEKEIKVEVISDDGIMKISFNRTKKANAMGRTMLSQLKETIDMLNLDSSKNIARCVILTSQSDKVFSAGADLKERSKMTMEEASLFVSTLRSTFADLATLPMPVIACVEGSALGGGLEIALTADIIIAGRNALFGLPETSLAIIPGAGGTQRLPRLIGTAQAKELIFTGKKIDSATALEYGLVQYEVDAGGTESKAIEIATQIVSNGPLAIRAAKEAINQGMNTNIENGLEIEKNCYASIIPTNDRLEGLQAFKEKRRPTYKGE